MTIKPKPIKGKRIYIFPTISYVSSCFSTQWCDYFTHFCTNNYLLLLNFALCVLYILLHSMATPMGTKDLVKDLKLCLDKIILSSLPWTLMLLNFCFGWGRQYIFQLEKYLKKFASRNPFICSFFSRLTSYRIFTRKSPFPDVIQTQSLSKLKFLPLPCL